VVDRLHSIRVPSLVVNGRFDAAQDAVVAPYFWQIAHAKWVRFEECSHAPFWENRERYMQLVSIFLDSC
jgi:pimeloyl-ACP methyl ester carboxylesterase